jgi:hypothetical protein
MIIAMLLSTASARTLKGDSCSEDYQPPNYWGKCVDGEYRNVDRDYRGYQLGCQSLVILVPKDVVGNKTLQANIEVHEGSPTGGLTLNDYGYYSLIFHQELKGPDVTIGFFLDGTCVLFRNYQQNYCFLQAGAITTNDDTAVSYEGSYGEDMPGHIITRL